MVEDYDVDDYVVEDDEYNTLNYMNSREDLLPLSEKKLSYQIIKEDEAVKQREAMINYASDRIMLERDSLILSLIYFKWDVDVLAERWYDKPEYYSYESGIELNPTLKAKLKKNKIEPNNDVCTICYTHKSELQKDEFFGLSCNHLFCKDCWYEYLKEKLNEVNTAILTNCPQLGCNCIVSESIFKKLIVQGTSEYKLWLKSIMKNFTDFNSVIKACPFPGCESYVHCEKKGNQEVTCTYCDGTFCFKCTQEGHRPCPCEMVKIWDSKNHSESENVKWLQVNTKKCPACHKHIEKNQGCNHMTCRKEAGGCGHEFCWICMGNWKGHNACNKFDDKKEEKDRVDIKHELDRYIFYFDRYMNHKKSLKYAIKSKGITERNIEKLNKIKQIPYTDLLFLREGILSVINARRTLFNSYIFGFYLKEDPSTNASKKLFEHHQGILEQNADKIHGFLENTQIEALLCIDNLDEFNSNFKVFKNNIIDLYTATNKFCKNVLDSIENDLIAKIKIN